MAAERSEGWLSEKDGAVEVEILAVPRASRSRIAGIHDARLKVQLAAPPADGEANQALIALLADLLDIRRSAISILAGHGSRTKRVRIEGVPSSAVRALVR